MEHNLQWKDSAATKWMVSCVPSLISSFFNGIVWFLFSFLVAFLSSSFLESVLLCFHNFHHYFLHCYHHHQCPCLSSLFWFCPSCVSWHKHWTVPQVHHLPPQMGCLFLLLLGHHQYYIISSLWVFAPTFTFNITVTAAVIFFHFLHKDHKNAHIWKSLCILMSSANKNVCAYLLCGSFCSVEFIFFKLYIILKCF